MSSPTSSPSSTSSSGTSSARSDQPELLLGPLLRHVGPSSATIWVEVDRPTMVEVLGWKASTFSVGGRHYALVIIEDLEPGSTTAYEVHLDGRQVWPPADSELPPSIIRVPIGTSDEEIAVLVGSCRAAAPHTPPYTLELAFDADGRGVDTLWAHAYRMTTETPDDWPDLLLLVGDQIYADDSSPGTKARIEALRPDDHDVPPEVVISYEEYCWLYHEAWTSDLERWMLSTVPSAMIFDDHDMIDDWNISRSWVEDIRREPWWQQHAIDGLVSYWVYQHLGNLSPDEIRDDGLLDALVAVDDGTEILHSWAQGSEAMTPVPGGYRFSYTRRVGDVTVVVIDCRNARVLTEGNRLMVGPEEWEWVRQQALATTGHLVLATSIPVFIADGLHDLQSWSEQICDGIWGRRAAGMGEKLRRALDLEGWAAFGASFEQFTTLLTDLRTATNGPRSIVVASGDIHFSYVARIPPVTGRPGIKERIGAGVGRRSRPVDQGPDVWQVVSSPTRNALIPHERGVLRFTLTRSGAMVGAALRRLARMSDTRPRIELAAGPFFANNMTELHYDAQAVWASIEQSLNNDDDHPELHEVARITLYGNGAEHRDAEVPDRAGGGHRLGRGLKRLRSGIAVPPER